MRKDISFRSLCTAPLLQVPNPVSDLSFQAMRKNRQEQTLSAQGVPCSFFF